jgi:DNA/RNA-binding domain of Phe-tRNA-synthetase-like protein
MQFIVHPEVFAHFPGMRLAVAVATGIDNQQEQPEVDHYWQEAWISAGKEAAAYGNAQSHPHVRPWRERFKAMGISGKEFPSSIEALLRRSLKGGEVFHINPLVDFYNAISLRYVVPAGGFDLEQIRGPLELRLTRAGDTFTPLGVEMAQHLNAGEIAYADGSTILTRHFVWRQAQTGLISATTRAVFLVSEVQSELDARIAESVLGEMHDGLQRYFQVEARTFLLDQAQSSIEF